MKSVQAEELSALLDGELDPGRQREVAAQMERDPALRLEFEALAAADAVWRASARSAAFTPDVRMPAAAEAEANTLGGGWLSALMLSIGSLIVVRVVLKLSGSSALAFGLPAISLLLLLAAVWLAGMELRRIPERPGWTQWKAS